MAKLLNRRTFLWNTGLTSFALPAANTNRPCYAITDRKLMSGVILHGITADCCYMANYFMPQNSWALFNASACDGMKVAATNGAGADFHKYFFFTNRRNRRFFNVEKRIWLIKYGNSAFNRISF